MPSTSALREAICRDSAEEVDAFLVTLDMVSPHESLACRHAGPPTRRGRSSGGGGQARLVRFTGPR